MTFPFSIDGTCAIPRRLVTLNTVEQMTRRVEEMLWRENAEVLTRSLSTVAFQVPIIVGWSWHILVQINKGEVGIEESGSEIKIKYALSTVRLFVGTTILMCVLVSFQFPFHAVRSGLIQLPFSLYIMGWLWLFGGNYLIARFRIPRWLKRGLTRSG